MYIPGHIFFDGQAKKFRVICTWHYSTQVAHIFMTLTLTVALSPQANYTDWATATCRRNLVPAFVDRGVSPLRLLISVFSTRAATLLSSSSSFILTRAEWTPFQVHCYSENVAAPGIEPGTSGNSHKTYPLPPEKK
jgi:hypothetical protein